MRVKGTENLVSGTVLAWWVTGVGDSGRWQLAATVGVSTAKHREKLNPYFTQRTNDRRAEMTCLESHR